MGKRWGEAYGDDKFSRLGAGRDRTAGAVGAKVGDAGEDGLVEPVDDRVGRDGVGQLVDIVEIRLVSDASKGAMAGARTGDGLNGCDLGGRLVGTDLVDPQQIRAQVGYDDVLARGVKDGVVQMRCVLAVGHGTRSGQGVLLLLQEGQVRWVADVVGREGARVVKGYCQPGVLGAEQRRGHRGLESGEYVGHSQGAGAACLVGGDGCVAAPAFVEAVEDRVGVVEGQPGGLRTAVVRLGDSGETAAIELEGRQGMVVVRRRVEDLGQSGSGQDGREEDLERGHG